MVLYRIGSLERIHAALLRLPPVLYRIGSLEKFCQSNDPEEKMFSTA